jgi:hypothetical protein
MILRYEMSTAAKKRNGGALSTRHAIRISARGTRALVVERPANLRGPNSFRARQKARCLLQVGPGCAGRPQRVDSVRPCSRCSLAENGRIADQRRRAPRSGRGGRRFKSWHSDQHYQQLTSPPAGLFYVANEMANETAICDDHHWPLSEIGRRLRGAQ